MQLPLDCYHEFTLFKAAVCVTGPVPTMEVVQMLPASAIRSTNSSRIGTRLCVYRSNFLTTTAAVFLWLVTMTSVMSICCVARWYLLWESCIEEGSRTKTKLDPNCLCCLFQEIAPRLLSLTLFSRCMYWSCSMHWFTGRMPYSANWEAYSWLNSPECYSVSSWWRRFLLLSIVEHAYNRCVYA